MKNGKKYKILAINDNFEQLELLTFILSQAGYQVATADSGNQGFEAAARELPDLVISDVMMSDGDGIELCRMIRADEKLCMLPILLLSALRKDTDSVLEGLEAGADDYMEVPYVTETLIAKSTRLIERKRLADALRESENRFRNLIENLTDVISTLTPDGTIIYESPSLEHVFGYKPEELLGKNAFDFVHPEDTPRVLEYFVQALQNSKIALPIEYRFRHKDDLWRIVESVGKKFIDPVLGHITIINSRDITERRRAQEQLDHFFEVSVDLLCFAGFDGYFKRINPAWEKVLGYSEEELLARPFVELIHPDDRKRTMKEFRQNLAGQKTKSFENRYLCRDGSYKWLLWNSTAIKDEQMIYGVAHDITERKQTENALRESQEHLALAQEVARIGSFEINLQTGRAKSSPALEVLYGAPLNGLNQEYEDWTKHVYPEDLSKTMREVEQGLATGEHESEFRISQKDGSIRWLYSKGKVFYDEKGAPLRLVGVNMDITERKQAETALTEVNDRAISEYVRLLERLAALGQKLGTARDLTAVFSAILDFASASVPCSALLISLYDSEKSTRKAVYMWYNGKEMEVSNMEPLAVSDGAVGEAVKTGEVTIINEYQKELNKATDVYLGCDEDPRETHSTIIAPMKIMGSVVGVIEIQSYNLGAYTEEHATAIRMAANLVANAIENVRLLEQERINSVQLRQAQKLESVGRLAGGIAHDFNNMLTAINGYSDLILRQVGDDSPIRPKVEEIKKAGERSMALTNQLLAFSRQQMLKTKVLNINEVIIETSKMLQHLIGEDIQLNILPAPKIGQIEADPGQLTQVVMNLAVNARDSMPGGGELTIETANVYLGEDFAARNVPTQVGSYVMLAVSDTGTGMDEETLQHIFEPFFTTKELGKGTGLGLATVYGIVKQSGGYIWVDSEIAKGTVFKIYLPRIDENSLLPEEQSGAENVQEGSETILLVEDEEIVRNLTRQMLESCGYKIIEAGNGREALSICQRDDCKIDLLITDVVMPKMSGRELGEQLAVLRPEITVLYMSGYTDDTAVRQDAVEAGANFIQKPFTFNNLAEKVRELLDAKTKAKAIKEKKD
jgi:PAS domain S-box-containing protein